MKKIFTCALVLGALALTSCGGNLKEISKQEFIDASKTLKTHDFTKAVAVVTLTGESPLGKINEKHEFHLNYANNIWTPVEQPTGDIVGSIASINDGTMQHAVKNIDEMPADVKFYQGSDVYKLESNTVMQGVKVIESMLFNGYGLPIELYELMDMSSEGATIKEEMKLLFTYSK